MEGSAGRCLLACVFGWVAQTKRSGEQRLDSVRRRRGKDDKDKRDFRKSGVDCVD